MAAARARSNPIPADEMPPWSLVNPLWNFLLGPYEDFAGWIFDGEAGTLTWDPDGRERFTINLNLRDGVTSDEMLDHLRGVALQEWATQSCIGALACFFAHLEKVEEEPGPQPDPRYGDGGSRRSG